MVRIYYHIYSIEGVESIIDEQLSLIEKHFDFPYILNIGISIADDNSPTDSIIKKLNSYNELNCIVRDIYPNGNEFVTLNLIEKDKETFADSDYIFYFHTKGSSKIKNKNKYLKAENWRNFMQHFNIERIKSIFRIFDRTDFNTYGALLKIVNHSNHTIYSGNFWWMKGEYAKTINIEGVKHIKCNAEVQYIQKGINWKPYSEYTNYIMSETYYQKNLRKEDYISLI
jgi:hypothetical protein